MNTPHQAPGICLTGHWLAVLATFLGLATPATASERILSFTSDVVVTEDGQLHVTETITVNAEGDKIKRGIYRDIPVRYGGDNFLGLKRFIPFTIAGIEYDGNPAAYHVDGKGDFHRIYIGQKNVTIPRGTHTYVIRYSTRQLRSFADHDEVYWNATGHAWAFPIDKAVATVTLPATVPLGQIDPEGYVGRLHSQNQQDLTAEVDLNQQQQVVYQTTRALKAGEGLTIVAQFPPGFISQQSTAAQLWSDPFLRWGGAGLAVVVGYFLIAWFLVGRDPPTGVILPRYEPPDGLSPAACRFISRMGYDKECFSVAILSLATQGALAIREDDGDYVLEKTGTPADTASPGEQKVFAKLLNDKTTLAVDKKHHTRFSKAIDLLRKSLVKEFEGSQFRPNRLWFFTGVLIAIAALLGSVFLAGGLAISGEVGFMTLWLTFWSVGVVALLHMVISAWRSFFTSGTALSRLAGAGSAIFITLFAVPFVGAELFVLGWLASLTSLWLIPLILGVVTTVAVFHELLKAPTITGRSLMDKIAGLRMYLATAEQDRLDALTRQAFDQPRGGPEPRSLELFERFLPYAVALNVANQWAEQFKDLIEAASIDPTSHQPTGYHPAWYHGNAWTAASIGAAATGLGTAMTSAVAAAATSPSSSSGGGGGGSSGGGGGGGGGGGW